MNIPSSYDIKNEQHKERKEELEKAIRHFIEEDTHLSVAKIDKVIKKSVKLIFKLIDKEEK